MIFLRSSCGLCGLLWVSILTLSPQQTETNAAYILTLTLPGPSAVVSGSLDSYCSLKPLCSGMGEVVPARTSPTLLPPSPRTVLSFPVSKCPSASTVGTGTVRDKATLSHKYKLSLFSIHGCGNCMISPDEAQAFPLMRDDST